MEPEGSLPPSQEPSTGPYPEPDRSIPHHPILSLISLLLLFQNKQSKLIIDLIGIVWDFGQGFL
jgi:hypothetical protein